MSEYKDLINQEARTEADRRWPITARPVSDYRVGKRLGFVAGAKWQASRPVTDEEVERAAIACFTANNNRSWTAEDWPSEWLGDSTRDIWRRYARAALEAAREDQE